MKTLLLTLVACLAVAQVPVTQDPFAARYQVNRETALTAAAEKITVQGTGTADAVYFESADVYCSAACVVTFSRDGTAASTTALSPVAVGIASSVAPNAYRSSNVGSGTTGRSYNIAAGGTMSFDLSAWYLPAGAPSTKNYSIATDSITATVRINIQFRLGR